MSDPTRSLRNLFKKIERATQEAVSKAQMEALGNFAVDLVVKRTRLGYGVPSQFGSKSRLRPLSTNYIFARQRFPGLSETTTSARSNLTRTGQMLASTKVISAQDGKVRFGPTGSRTDSRLTNLQVAGYQENQGRIFNRISSLEADQTLRFYRREFGDLLRRRQLIT